MKSFFGFLLLFVLVSIKAFAIVESCPNRYLTTSATLSEMQDRNFWKTCTQEDLKHALMEIQIRQRAYDPEKKQASEWEKVYLAIRASARPQESLVKVSSVLFDYDSEKFVRITGVGSLISINEKLFVLTADHVSSGSNLTVTTFDGQVVPILKAQSDSDNDISLLEIDLAKNSVNTFPLAEVTAPSNLVTTNLSEDISFEGTQFIDRNSGQEFQGLPIEGLGGFIRAGGTSSVLKASWLKKIAKFNLTGTNKTTVWINRSQDLGAFSGVDSFDSGYSGSPVVFSYPHPKLGVVFYLGGILTMSNPKNETSGFVGVGPIQQLFKFDRAGKSEGQQTIWGFFDGTFIKATQNGLEIFLNSGPVGNGVIIEGIQATDAEKAKDKLVKLIKRDNTPADNIKNDLKERIKDLKESKEAGVQISTDKIQIRVR